MGVVAIPMDVAEPQQVYSNSLGSLDNFSPSSQAQNPFQATT